MMCVAPNMPTEAEAHLDVMGNAPSKDISGNGEDVDRAQALSSASAASPQNLVKRPRRQWAAWTRQEEERFFNALREGGKNFQKITCQVQTKNKDQVRHYYYRLVRRMNKLLGPGLSLDMKNSKDTNAAMLHWWSLLQKYSCTASKLRLKPRRFKIFIENLVQQLLKDRNKSRRKRPFRGENYSSVSTTANSILNMQVANDIHAVNQISVDDQNTQKLGHMKESARKHHVNASFNGNKGDLSSTIKNKKQKHQTGQCIEGGITSTAHQRQEETSIDRISLVSCATEHLERTTNCRNHSSENETFDMPSQKNCAVNISSGLCAQQQVGEANIQSFSKLKLQLFPIDEGTRMEMERNGHNPHLELTVSPRKRILSIVGHLNQKWGKFSIASGELVLLPYGIRRNRIAGHPRWTLKDSAANAGNVYASVGSPAIFRLSYGWFSDLELRRGYIHLSSSAHHLASCMPSEDHLEENMHAAIGMEVEPSSPIRQNHLPAAGDADSNLMVVTTAIPAPPSHMCGTESQNGNKLHMDASVGVRDEVTVVMKHQEVKGTLRTIDEAAVSAGDWADSLTNISIGDLLSETPTVPDLYRASSPAEGNSPYHQPLSFSSDSFDAAIARFISGHHDIEKLFCCPSPKSFLNAEETCDEFLFHKVPDINQENLTMSSDFSFGGSKGLTPEDTYVFQSSLEDFGAETKHVNNHPEGDSEADLEFDQELLTDDKLDPGKNVALADVYWPDSLGPLNLDISCTRSQGMDLLSSESISLSGLCLW